MFCWGHSSDPSPLSVGLLLHTHTMWVCAVGGPGLFTLSLNPPGAVSVPVLPFSLCTFPRDSGKDLKVWVTCPFSAWGE